MKTVKSMLAELKEAGVKYVNLNGWKENIEYVMSLSSSSLIYIGETKSDNGYDMIECFETTF